MGQKAKSFKISHDLHEASWMHAALEGYPSWAAYVKTLIRKDLGGSICDGYDLKKITLRQGDALDLLIYNKQEETIASWSTE